MVEETEVFMKYYSGLPEGHPNKFDKSKCYEFALWTRREGVWPNEKYYTTNPLQYLGKHISRDDTGGIWGDGRSGCDYFSPKDGIQIKLEDDYNGRNRFREVACQQSGGNKKKNYKSRKNSRKNIKKSALKNNRNL